MTYRIIRSGSGEYSRQLAKNPREAALSVLPYARLVQSDTINGVTVWESHLGRVRCEEVRP